MGAFGIGESNERYRLIDFAEEHKLFMANTLFQTRKKPEQILDLGVTRWGNKKPNRFCI